MHRIIVWGLSCLLCLSAGATHPRKAAEWTDEMLQGMTLDEKIGQLFMIADRKSVV